MANVPIFTKGEEGERPGIGPTCHFDLLTGQADDQAVSWAALGQPGYNEPEPAWIGHRQIRPVNPFPSFDSVTSRAERGNATKRVPSISARPPGILLPEIGSGATD